MQPPYGKGEDTHKEKEYEFPVVLKLSKTVEKSQRYAYPLDSWQLSQGFLFILALCTYLLLPYSISPTQTTRTHLHAPSNEPGFVTHCANTTSIGSSEFRNRQRRLAETLVKLNASAYITEPGANGLFFFNVSTSNWFLSERPLLLIITPSHSDTKIEPKVSVLTPKVIPCSHRHDK